MAKSSKQLDREIAAAVASGGVSDELLSVVRRAAGSVGGSGRIGDRKVFISSLYDAVSGSIGMDLPSFKRWLLDQHRSRRLVLTRADFVSAMDSKKVARSETRTDGAMFHFVIDDSLGRDVRPDSVAEWRSDSVSDSRVASARVRFDRLIALNSKSSRDWSDVAADLRSEAAGSPLAGFGPS